MGVEVRHFPNSTVNIEFLGDKLAMLLTERGFTLTFKGSTFKKRKDPEYKVKLIKAGFLRRVLGMVYTFNITLQKTDNVVMVKVDDGGLRNQLGVWVIATIPPFWILWIFLFPSVPGVIYAWKHKEKIRKEILTQAETLSKYGESPTQQLIGKQEQEPKPQETSNTNKINEKKFKVTLLGIAEGSNREETEAKLAAIFKKTPNQIRTLLDKRAVIGNNLVRDKAIKYKQALEKAGALYKIKTIKQDLPNEPKTYCRNCGSEVAEQAVMCVKCGVPSKNGTKFCQNCGKTSNPNAEICVKCGVRLAIENNTGIATVTSAKGSNVNPENKPVITWTKGFFIAWWNHIKKLRELPKAEDKKQWILDNKISLVVAFFTFCWVIAIITPDDFNENKGLIETAAISCKRAAEKYAKWGTDSDWGLKYTARNLDENRIEIVGKDIQFKNAFNAQRYAPYTGIYYVSKNACIIVGID